MHKTPLFPTLLGLLLFIGLAHFISTHFYLYWYTTWVDDIMHFLSGALVSLSALWLFCISGYVSDPPKRRRGKLFVSLYLTFLVGILWEVFELTSGITSLAEPFYYAENIGDIVNDMIGGFVGYLYFSYKNFTK